MMEQVQMLSVGIDIGTSTTQVIFSRLTVENTAGYFSVPAVSISGKEVVYQSPVYATPLLDETRIDGDALGLMIEREYATAGIAAGQVKTGAAIITGEAARKENARLVLEQLSSFAGDFVVSTAGPDLESVIAGQGSGACRFSEENGVVVANLDIGGGTTNIVVFDSGEVAAMGCLDIGGRQVRIDEQGRIVYVSPSAARIAEARGLPVPVVGETASVRALEQLCAGMAEALAELLENGSSPGLLEEVRTHGSSRFQKPERDIRYLCFSGGVADCIRRDGANAFAYGDIGVLLGKAMRESRAFGQFQRIEAAQTIRATVIGAGSYTTTVSGSTIDYSAEQFPMKNIPVWKLTRQEEAACWEGRTDVLEEGAKWFLAQNDSPRLALALEGKKDPDYPRLKRLSAAVAAALNRAVPAGEPLIVIVRADMAKVLGQQLRRELPRERAVVVLDEIRVGQNNFVDFGRPVMNGLVIPVVVKTLIFG